MQVHNYAQRRARQCNSVAVTSVSDRHARALAPVRSPKSLFTEKTGSKAPSF
ncbi:hypothetical protein V5G28_009555 [Scytonema sp. PRP1]